MIHKITYTEKLNRYVKSDNLIPYRLHKNARFRNNCYYWISYDDQWMKVEEVLYNFNFYPNPLLDHIIARSQDGNVSYICTDLSINDFRLEKDKYNIRNKENIINCNESFSGGEIEYWLFIHDITSLNKKYREFWKYLSVSGKDRIDSNKYYFIKADISDNEIYTNVKFIHDRTREKFRRSQIVQP